MTIVSTKSICHVYTCKKKGIVVWFLTDNFLFDCKNKKGFCSRFFFLFLVYQIFKKLNTKFVLLEKIIIDLLFLRRDKDVTNAKKIQ